MIELQQITKIYGRVPVVDELSLTVEEGELLVLLGSSGSGKTTTLKMINRLIEPTAGHILLKGEDVTTVPAHELRRRIGYAFQKVGLFPHMTVADNIAITPTLLEWDAVKIRDRVDELLELVELEPDVMRDRFPSELSGGQQQRVGVARALAAAPLVMLLDEPFGALDPLTRAELHELLAEVRRREPVTIVLVTHDLAEALDIAERVAVLRDGALAQYATPDELRAEPADPWVARFLKGVLHQPAGTTSVPGTGSAADTGDDA
jgi:osmoprotectant transport system ATP-binding protein